jgi:hypothetical protein
MTSRAAPAFRDGATPATRREINPLIHRAEPVRTAGDGVVDGWPMRGRVLTTDFRLGVAGCVRPSRHAWLVQPPPTAVPCDTRIDPSAVIWRSLDAVMLAGTGIADHAR